MDRKWKLTRYGLMIGTATLATLMVHHITGEADNTGLILGSLGFIAGVIGEYFAVNATINSQKSKNYRAEIKDEQ